MNAYSSRREKDVASPIDYEATYLVIAHCAMGSTFSGADIEGVAAGVVTATRTGLPDESGKIVASKKDRFKFVKAIDPSTISK